MSGVIPTVLSPARVSQALASAGPPAGSGGLRISSTDPLAPGNGIETQPRLSGSRPKSTSPSRAIAMAFPSTTTCIPGSPFSADASPIPMAPSPADGGGGTTAGDRGSGSGTGEPSSTATSARSLNGRQRLPASKSFRGNRPDSPKANGGRVQLAAESSANSLSTAHVGGNGNGGGGGGVSSPGQRATYMSSVLSARGSRGGLGRDRSYAGSASSATGGLRLNQSSMSGGYTGGLESLGGLGGRGGPAVGLQPAPGTVGGIDVSRLAAIQRLLDEYDSDEAADVTSPRPEGSSYRRRSDSHSGEGGVRHRGSDSDSGTGSASGLRSLVSLRSRKDMQNWQPTVSAMKGSLEEHQQRLRERADVTQHLKRWTEQVLEDAKRAAAGGTSSRASDIVRAASVRFKGVDEDHPESSSPSSPSPTPGVGRAPLELEFVDPDQELDDEEERRMEALMALPPNPRGLGAQLRTHFMNVVEDEVNKKIDALRAKWEAEKCHEAEELRELKESYREVRRHYVETKEALDKANTRLDVMKLQMKATAALNKVSKDATAAAATAAAAAPDGDGAATAATAAPATKGGRGSRVSTHDGSEGKTGGKGGKGGVGVGNAISSAENGAVTSALAPGAAGGHDDDLHDKLKSIGSRRPTSPTGDGDAAQAASAELQQQLRAHVDAAMNLNRKLQDAEQQLAKLKLDKTLLEQQLAAAGTRGGGAGEPGAAAAASGGGKYDADVQIFKLKQEKASLEQQLAATKSKSSSKGGKSGGGAAAKGGGSSFRAGGKAGSGGAAAAKVAELTEDVERLQIELAASKRVAANSSKEATDRRMELQKAKDDLSATKAMLDMAMQQIESVKEALAGEKERADRAVAAAVAAEEAQAAAQASAAAANSAAAAALVKRSAATGEVQELLERLEKERDVALTAAGELRQQARDLSNSLSERADEVMQLREQLMQRQMESSTAPEAAPPEQAAAAAAAPQPPISPAAGSNGVGGPHIHSKVTAAAVAAMQSLGVSLRQVPVVARRRPTSAVGPSGAASVGLDSAVGVAAAAAAAAALIPAVLEVLRQRIPEMVMALEAAAPFIASTFVDLMRAELLQGDGRAAVAADSNADAGPAAAAAAATGAASARSRRPENIMAGGLPSQELVSEQLDKLSALGSDRLYVFRNGTPPTATPAAATADGAGSGSGGLTVTFADADAGPPGGPASAAAASRPPAPPPPPVVVDGVTFYPLGVRESPKSSRRTGGSTIAAMSPDPNALPPTPEGREEEGEDSDGTAATATTAAVGGGYRAHANRSSYHDRDAILESYGSIYLDPELASVLQVGRVSPKAARAAGAGRGAISPEALGPSLRDRALSALQAPEPLPPPRQRPQSAAVRTIDAARQVIAHHGGGVLRFGQSARPVSAVLPPVRALTANPQKGVQLATRLRGPRQQSGRVSVRWSQQGGEEEEEAAVAVAGGAAVTGRLVPGLGLGPPMREVQLHTGLHGPPAATYLVSGEASAGPGPSGGGGGGDVVADELPTTGPQLAALARELMAAQEKAARELEAAMGKGIIVFPFGVPRRG
ncbi:hypothetical protein VOLCADRAFT_90546 [Volvox carteri f. nagariensis]|uniref:Uncharacterized protein n=1 Tax=Volvox carteri f. nagariensis TaxID=3068 RepID=D8TUP3_VOLCA|nr:uncharacterized protein VOLCADRAFT_90546 [Volvox carteri f. nagariensis]EFJ48743.1 hypothetical protein VOLCADRAFT_90546 [Volvox carteri f. nagariensis]|eukprot:XP_002950075.1 hypothetical protein VOLCADRAFT_90546 [Volvox carteri f. nagariensis]